MDNGVRCRRVAQCREGSASNTLDEREKKRMDPGQLVAFNVPNLSVREVLQR